MVNIPMIADADTGYGNAVNLVRTVRDFERAGVAAIHIEDQITPKRCGHLDGKEVIPLERWMRNSKPRWQRAAIPISCIIARTDARGVNGFDDAIERARPLPNSASTRSFSKRRSPRRTCGNSTRVPNVLLLVNVFKGGKTPMLPMERLEKMGFRIAIYPSEPKGPRSTPCAMR